MELRREGDGAAAYRDGVEIARLHGELREPPRLYRQAWIEVEGERAAWPDLYALAGDAWVRAGYLAHQVVVDASDAEQLDLWYGLAFGRQQVYASQPLAPVTAPDGPVRVREGTLDDALSLRSLIADHLHGPPVWSTFDDEPPGEAREAWAEYLAEPGTYYLVGELDGQPVAHLGLAGGDEPGATYLPVGATVPEARGRGAMRALWAAAVGWALEQGYGRCDTDWRSTSLEAARCWTALGFRPTRYRLHRLVGR
jgi:GNAT superfamily N-acetyltransferase